MSDGRDSWGRPVFSGNGLDRRAWEIEEARRAYGGQTRALPDDGPGREVHDPDVVTQIGHAGVLGAEPPRHFMTRVINDDEYAPAAPPPPPMGTMRRTSARGDSQTFAFVHDSDRSRGGSQALPADSSSVEYQQPPPLTGMTQRGTSFQTARIGPIQEAPREAGNGVAGAIAELRTADAQTAQRLAEIERRQEADMAEVKGMLATLLKRREAEPAARPRKPASHRTKTRGKGAAQ